MSEELETGVGALLTTADQSRCLCLYPLVIPKVDNIGGGSQSFSLREKLFRNLSADKGDTGYGAHGQVQRYREDIHSNAGHDNLAVLLAERHSDHRSFQLPSL